MRKIKFRAWDKEKQEMVYVLEMKFLFESPAGIWVMGYSNDKIDHEIFPENLEIMQYTGLKDKDGKEIYEGDLIAGKGPSFAATKTEVFFNYNGAYAEFGDHNILLSRFNEIEVIGNIYENPELLEKE